MDGIRRMFAVVPKSSAPFTTSPSTSHVSLLMTSYSGVAQVLNDSVRSAAVTVVTFRPPKSQATEDVAHHTISTVHPLPLGRPNHSPVNIQCTKVAVYADMIRSDLTKTFKLTKVSPTWPTFNVQQPDFQSNWITEGRYIAPA